MSYLVMNVDLYYSNNCFEGHPLGDSIYFSLIS